MQKATWTSDCLKSGAVTGLVTLKTYPTRTVAIPSKKMAKKILASFEFQGKRCPGWILVNGRQYAWEFQD